MDLWQDFQTNQGKVIRKWEHYFPVYERHFGPWRGRSLTFLEVGVAHGGSLAMWRRFFGPLATVVGVDIDPKCRAHEENGVFVRIGDQSDPKFLESLVEEFGVPDVVLDDGSHQMAHVHATFDAFYPRMGKNGVYMVEDLHTAYWPDFGGGLKEPNSFIERAKSLVDQLNADHARGALAPDAFTRETLSISFYDSMVVFEKGRVPRKTAPEIGALPGKKPAIRQM
ncbi:MAG: class I SAM-dependent methyltransferase [Caulobacteraceae bacterium]|nr:class I SAM-dependent methyltransferase [Caulobacteraceae bacterium]